MSDLVEFYRNLVPAGMGVRNPDDYGVMVSVSKAMETAAEIERLRGLLHIFMNYFDSMNDKKTADKIRIALALGEGK